MRPCVSPTASFQGGCTPCNHWYPGCVGSCSHWLRRRSAMPVWLTPMAVASYSAEIWMAGPYIQFQKAESKDCWASEASTRPATSTGSGGAAVTVAATAAQAAAAAARRVVRIRLRGRARCAAHRGGGGRAGQLNGRRRPATTNWSAIAIPASITRLMSDWQAAPACFSGSAAARSSPASRSGRRYTPVPPSRDHSGSRYTRLGAPGRRPHPPVCLCRSRCH